MSLKNHKLKHQDGKYKCCMYCDYRNLIWNNLKYHIDATHPDHGEKKHLCDLCGKGFSRFSLKKHIEAVHGGLKNFQCNYCEKSFSQLGNLKRHIQSIHEGAVLGVDSNFES